MVELVYLPAQAGTQDLKVKRMFYVYAISSRVKSYIYVGLTDNLERRLKQHFDGRSKTTRPYRPFELIYSETKETRIAAREREKYFKTSKGKDYLRTISK